MRKSFKENKATYILIIIIGLVAAGMLVSLMVMSARHNYESQTSKTEVLREEETIFLPND
jgi:flagellar basal body-associated protein FliL